MRLLAVAVVAAVLLAGCNQGTSTDHPAPGIDPATGETRIGPNWTYMDTKGVTHGRDSTLGAPAGIFFMAVWCPKCARLAPNLADIYAEYESRGFQMYSISWDPQTSPSKLDEWSRTYNNNWPHGLDPRSRVAQTFDVTSQSSMVILDANGNPVKTWIYDNPSKAALREAIDEAFARSAAGA
jgi:peroxiredoxin